jgi:hypothetical protein
MNRNAFWLIAALLISGCSPSPAPIPPVQNPLTDAEIRTLPISIFASQTGKFKNGNAWSLSVGPAGHFDLNIQNVPKDYKEPLRLSSESSDRIRELLVADNFFLLADEYGEKDQEGHTKTVSVAIGKTKKTIRIHYRKDGSLTIKDKAEEVPRALHTYNVIRSWFHVPVAANTIETDNKVMRNLLMRGSSKQ